MSEDEGFVRPPAIYTMDFREPAFAGLWVKVLGMTGESMAALGRTEATADNPMPAAPLFMEQVDSWNLKDGDGRCVPITFDALMRYDLEFIYALVGTWVREVMPARYPQQPGLTVTSSTVLVQPPDAAPTVSDSEIESRTPDEDAAVLSALRVFSRSAA